MSQVTAQMQNVAKHLITNDSSQATGLAAFSVIDKLGPHLAMLMGNGGFHALLSRALVLANGEVSWLHAMHVSAGGVLEGFEAIDGQLGPAGRLEGRVVLLAHLLGLLVAFIGPSLTSRIVGDIWPQILLNDFDFGNGGTLGKTK